MNPSCLHPALHTAGFTVSNLQAALAAASATEALVLLPLIERAAALARDIAAVELAITQDRNLR